MDMNEMKADTALGIALAAARLSEQLLVLMVERQQLGLQDAKDIIERLVLELAEARLPHAPQAQAHMAEAAAWLDDLQGRLQVRFAGQGPASPRR